jgi:3-oxoacyl-[acyl-carrier protein] reductase
MAPGALSGRRLLVTGAGGGIGGAVAEAALRQGARVALADIDLERAEAAAAALGGARAGALALRLDVSRPAEVAAVIEEVAGRHGGLDVLVNNAGICPRIPIDDIREADFDRIVGVNLKGTFFACQAAAAVMRRQQSGVIVNVSSIGARTGGFVASSVYSATKAGIVALTKSFARALAPFARVNAIAPGVVDTEMMRLPAEQVAGIVAQVPLGRLGRPEEIAAAIVFLASDASSYLTGATLDCNGGWVMV